MTPNERAAWAPAAAQSGPEFPLFPTKGPSELETRHHRAQSVDAILKVHVYGASLASDTAVWAHV
jgi:hypothetical protein